MGEAASNEVCGDRGSEGVESLGVETDFRFREERAPGAALLGRCRFHCYILMLMGSLSLKLRADLA